MFVDVAGRTTEVIDANAREIIPAQIFVAVRGASGSTYADATFTQHARPIGSARMSGGLALIGGMPAQLGLIRFSTGTETSSRVF